MSECDAKPSPDACGKISTHIGPNKKTQNYIDHDVKTVEGQVESGIESWNLTSKANQAISSGIYIFTVEDRYKNTQTGKFVIIK